MQNEGFERQGATVILSKKESMFQQSMQMNIKTSSFLEAEHA